MGISREILLKQNPNFKSSQIELLYHSLINGDFDPFDVNGYVHFKLDDRELISLLADDIGLKEQEKALRIAQENNIPISIQLSHNQHKKNITLVHFGNDYRFQLESIASDDQYKLIYKTHESIKKCIPNEFHGNRIDWIMEHSEEIIRCETDMHHEGVLILCSSNRLKEFYKDKEFNYDYPDGLSDLLGQRIIIAIDSKDYSYSTIIEKEILTEWEFGYYNSIEFTNNDKLLVLHHGDFTMICDNHQGDYMSYRWPHIIALPIENEKDQVMFIAKPNEENDRKLIIQFQDIASRKIENNLIEYERIPTHNK